MTQAKRIINLSTVGNISELFQDLRRLRVVKIITEKQTIKGFNKDRNLNIVGFHLM